jgi:hypothetical protein
MANRVTTPVPNFETLSPPWSLISLDQNSTAFQNGFNDSSLGWVNGIPTDTGVANAYVVTLPFGTPVQYNQGFTVVFIPANANTGSSTINVNGLGIKSLVSANGAALTSGQLLTTNAYICVYDSASFRVLNLAPLGSAVFGLPTDTGAANAYVVTTPFGSPVAYNPGTVVVFVPNNTNTGASTINVDGLGVKNITDSSNNTLVAGALLAGRAATICYDGTEFRLLQAVYGVNIYNSASFSLSAFNSGTAITGWSLSSGLGLGVTYDGASGFTLTNGASIVVLGVSTGITGSLSVVGCSLILISGTGFMVYNSGDIAPSFQPAANVSAIGLKGAKFQTNIEQAGSGGPYAYNCFLGIFTIPF